MREYNTMVLRKHQQKFDRSTWILRGRSTVNSVVSVLCRRFEGKPFTAAPAQPLPEFRVQKSKPFANTAIDFAGPLHVKTYGVTESEKMCIHAV